MSFDNNKHIGNTALGQAIAYFTSLDYCVSVPLNDTQDYDLIVDIAGKLNKIQVRGTTQRGKYKSKPFIVHLNCIGGRTGKTYKLIKDIDVDYLFIVTSNYEKYLIPLKAIKYKYSLTLGKEMQQYRII